MHLVIKFGLINVKEPPNKILLIILLQTKYEVLKQLKIYY